MQPILIVGTGALASFFVARLSAASIPVSMTGTWTDGIAVIRSKGVILVDQQEMSSNYPVKIVTDFRDCDEVIVRIHRVATG